VKGHVRTRRKIRMKTIGTPLFNQQKHEVDSLWPLGLMNEKANTRLAKISSGNIHYPIFG